MHAFRGRRLFRRYEAAKAVLVERAGLPTEGIFGLTGDLGPGGCSIVSTAPLTAGSRVRVYLSLDSEVVEAEGRVAHESSRPNGWFRLGIEFLRMDQVHRARYHSRFEPRPGDFSPPSFPTRSKKDP